MNKKLVKKIERFLSYSSPCSIAVQYVFTQKNLSLG